MGALIVSSILGSTLSLYRITEVNRLLDAINRVSVPLGRLFTQIQNDADLFRREFDRGLGSSHWKDPHWRPRSVPRWIGDVLDHEVGRVGDLVKIDMEWAPAATRSQWKEWATGVSQGLKELRTREAQVYAALEQRDWDAAEKNYSAWISSMDEWRRQIQWGAIEYERLFRQTFTLAENRVSELRTGLEMILIVVVALSLLLLWLSERALRPVPELTRLAREITHRGLRKDDKAKLPQLSLSRSDEVSQLAREFHHMATALLEREKTVETQKHRLVEQNKLLREIGELNENILNSIESILVVTDLTGRIAQVNPVAARWLNAKTEEIRGTELSDWPKLALALTMIPSQSERKIEPTTIDGHVYGGEVFALRGEENGATVNRGAIIVLEDLTEELELQERLRRAENLAAVGRMSAQVAHEVRNPLHSIGLEAEMAAELAARLGSVPLKQSLHSILQSVDRLEKITENYLKLSRLSAGTKGEVDLSQVLEATLATYAPVCESQGVRVDWHLESGASFKVWGDGELLEQVFGNLFRNALQALEGSPNEERRIRWNMGSAESGAVWVRIEDNGPGIPPELRPKLFTPFVTTRAQGTGLGLSFIKKVLEEHGATIRCLDREPGQGAAFEMILRPERIAAETMKTELPRLQDEVTLS